MFRSTSADLKGKKFMAVKKSSFGGWQMAYKEFVDAGLDPFKDFASMEFSGKHDKVVVAVKNGQMIGPINTSAASSSILRPVNSATKAC